MTYVIKISGNFRIEGHELFDMMQQPLSLLEVELDSSVFGILSVVNMRAAEHTNQKDIENTHSLMDKECRAVLAYLQERYPLRVTYSELIDSGTVDDWKVISRIKNFLVEAGLIIDLPIQDDAIKLTRLGIEYKIGGINGN